MPTIRELRKSKAMTLEELAFKSQVSWRTIFRIESGKTIPHRNTLAAIAKTLKVKPNEIEFEVKP